MACGVAYMAMTMRCPTEGTVAVAGCSSGRRIAVRRLEIGAVVDFCLQWRHHRCWHCSSGRSRLQPHRPLQDYVAICSSTVIGHLFCLQCPTKCLHLHVGHLNSSIWGKELRYYSWDPNNSTGGGGILSKYQENLQKINNNYAVVI